MSDRRRRKSVNRHASDGTIARLDSEMAKALEEVAQSLPNNFFVDEATIDRDIRDYEKACRRKGVVRVLILNTIFDQLYGAYVYLHTHLEERERFFYRCRCANITVNSRADLSDILVAFYVRGRSKKAVKYAAALCEGALQKIKVGDLALRLGNVGPDGMRSLGVPTNIKEMAEQFANRRPGAARPQDESPATIEAKRTERPAHFPDSPKLEQLLASYAPEIGSFDVQMKRRNARALRKFLFGPKGLKNVPEDGSVLELPLSKGWRLRLS